MSKEHSFEEDDEIWGFWHEDVLYYVGGSGYDKITLIIDESHTMKGILWFAVWRNGEIVSKHNAVFVTNVISKNMY